MSSNYNIASAASMLNSEALTARNHRISFVGAFLKYNAYIQSLIKRVHTVMKRDRSWRNEFFHQTILFWQPILQKRVKFFLAYNCLTL